MVQRSNNCISLRREDGGISAEMTVQASVERVWRVLTSFEEMPAHLSGLRRSRILQREGKRQVVEQTTTVGIPLLPLTFKLVMDVVEERPFLYFNQRLGSFTSFSGHWWVDPASEGNGTRIQYFLKASLGGGWKGGPFKNRIKSMIHQNLQELAVWIDNGSM
ncbi:MAG: SRPBCC family protein [Deltaproteobacteria bacterium]|nr:SRPBCC family protein [Deltaproteobacteria bacterium]